MFQRIAARRRAHGGAIRCVCLPCLFLILQFCLSLPLSAVTAGLSAEPAAPPGSDASGGPELAVFIDPGPALDELKPGDQIVVAIAGPDLEKLLETVSPRGALIVGQGRPVKVRKPDLTKMPGRLATAGLLLIPLDSALTDVIPRTPADGKTDGFTEAANKLGGREGLLATIGGLYLLGDDYDKDTAKLALAALVNASITTEGVKMLTGRERPDVSGGLLKFHGPTVSSGGDLKSFPSGHTAAAFAVATVLANRHPKQKWLYYGLATAVGYARIRKSAHFPSDVIVGAAIGINAGNRAVQNGPRIFSIKL